MCYDPIVHKKKNVMGICPGSSLPDMELLHFYNCTLVYKMCVMLEREAETL